MMKRTRRDELRHLMHVMKKTAHPVIIAASAMVLSVGAAFSPKVMAQECVGTRNFIATNSQYFCIRELSPGEVREINKRQALFQLNQLESIADQDVERGYDPSVSVSEFSRRLDVRSEIQDRQRRLRYE